MVDRDELFNYLKNSSPQIDAIIHLGACTDTLELNVEFLRQVNFEYTQKLWLYANAARVPFIYASSAATYGAGELGYEDDESLIANLKPLNPYGQSKQDFDLWALAQEKSGNHPPAWAGFKFFNVYGFGERHKGRMASVILHSYDQIVQTGGVKLFRSHRAGIANGHQMRDFVSVEDTVSVLQLAAEKPIARGIFNLGSGRARTFLDLARATFSAMGLSERIEFVDTPEVMRERYQYFTEARMDKLRAEFAGGSAALGYAKLFSSLEDGVARYVKRLRDSSGLGLD